MATDEEIGRNLVRVRGSRSQKDVATAMRQRGFRWSQATVWAIEKGDRPLRLSEAEALGAVLGAHHTILLESLHDINLLDQFRHLANIWDEIGDLAYESFERQRVLAYEIDAHPNRWDEDPESFAVISRNAADAAIDGLVRAEAHYRGLRDVSSFGAEPSTAPAIGKYSEAFASAIEDRLANERERLRAARSEENADGVDQTT